MKCHISWVNSQVAPPSCQWYAWSLFWSAMSNDFLAAHSLQMMHVALSGTADDFWVFVDGPCIMAMFPKYLLALKQISSFVMWLCANDHLLRSSCPSACDISAYEVLGSLVYSWWIPSIHMQLHGCSSNVFRRNEALSVNVEPLAMICRQSTFLIQSISIEFRVFLGMPHNIRAKAVPRMTSHWRTVAWPMSVPRMGQSSGHPAQVQIIFF